MVSFTDEELRKALEADTARVNVTTPLPEAPQDESLLNFDFLRRGISTMRENMQNQENPLASISRFFSPDEGKQHAPVTSLAAGAIDTATYGNTGPFLAGQEAVAGMPILGPSVGAGNAAFNMIFGEPLIGKRRSGEIEEEYEERRADNPYTAVAGQVLGAFVTGGGAAKLTQYAGNKVARLMPKAAKVVDFLGNSLFGRIASNAFLGGVEGGLYARSKDGSITEGAGIGALGGGLVSGAQEMLGVAARVTGIGQRNAKTSGRARVADTMMDVAGAGSPEGAPAPTWENVAETATARTNELGPLSSLADTEAGTIQAAALVTDPRRAMASRGIVNYLEGRDALAKGQFSREAEALLPQQFARANGMITTAPRSLTEVQAQAKEFFKSLEPEYDRVFAETDVVFQRPRLENIINSVFEDSNVKGVIDLENTLQAEVNALFGKTTRIQDQARAAHKPIPRNRSQRDQSVYQIQPRDLHAFSKELRTRIDALYVGKVTSADQEKIRLLSQLRHEIDTVLVGRIPELGDLTAASASEHSYMRMYVEGQKFLRPKTDATQVTAAIDKAAAGASPADLQGYNEGVARAIVDGLKPKRGEIRWAQQLQEDQNLVEKMTAAYGPEKTRQFIEEAGAALDLIDNRKTITSGSQSAIVAGVRQSNTPDIINTDRTIVIGTIIARLMGTNTISNAAGLGAARRWVRAKASPEESAEMARLLSTPGPRGVQQSLADIGQVLDQPPVLPVPLGGPDALLNPPRNAWQSLLQMDVGQTVPQAGAVAATSQWENQPNKVRQRRRNRREQ